MDIVLCGHSFVRRYRDWISPCFPRSDVQPSNKTRAATFATALRLDKHFRYVYTVSDNIVFLRDLINALPSILCLHAQIVVIDIGSNDLSKLTSHCPKTTVFIANEIFSFANNVCAPRVVINAVLPRVGNLACSPDTFLLNSRDLNNYLSTLCSVESHIHYNKLKGFHYNLSTSRISLNLSLIGPAMASTAMSPIFQNTRHACVMP